MLVGVERAAALRSEASALPTRTLDPGEQDVLELLLLGVWAPLTGYPDARDRRSIRERMMLVDGTPWALDFGLPRDGLDVEAGERVALRDSEGVLLAVLDVASTEDGLLAGRVEGVALPGHADHRDVRLSPASVRNGLAGRIPQVVIARRALHRSDLDDLSRGDEPLVLLSAPPAGAEADSLVAAHHAAVELLRAAGRETFAVLLPQPHPPDDEPARTALADRLLASAFRGEVRPLGPGDEDRRMRTLLREGLPVPPALSPTTVVAALARVTPPVHQQGFVVLFTGLSGSGKSTISQLVGARLRELGTRPVTVLDGDVVRTHLSRGLGFSATDRDVNVRRIGWVAAQLARHRGAVLAAPIAPYAAARADVRAMVEGAGGVHLEVHVATPLTVCETRDRKGLYALARAGKLTGFTGIDDPYEVPEAPDLLLDTSETSADAAADAVWALLVARGLVRP